MKTANELEKLDRQVTDAENEFWIQAGNTVTSLITAKCKESEDEKGVYKVDVDKLFGDECRILHTTEIENDEISGSDGSEWEWEVEEIWMASLQFSARGTSSIWTTLSAKA